MEYGFSQEEWVACIKVLQALKEHPFENPDNQTFKTLVTAIHKQAKRQGKKENHRLKKEEDAAVLGTTGIVAQVQAKSAHYAHIADTAEHKERKVHFARHCYACSKPYHDLHFFYHRLCPECAATHYGHRQRSCDLSGYNAVLTGGRVKIGYAAALKLLRSGANLLLTTRFPAIAYETLSREADFASWKDRLTVYGLDLRNLQEVRQFISYCYEHLGSLEILINNAAQTIRYPAEYYRPLMMQERQLLLQPAARIIANTTAPSEEFLPPPGQLLVPESPTLNRFGQPVDFRDKNSWNSLLGEVGLEELLEVNMINHISPYCLISGLKNLMLQSAVSHKFIINVTSSEGQFSYAHKNSFHPHTNMTKAALNMLTRTSALELVQDHIYMNAVDVGWVSTGVPEAKREQLFRELRIPPLDPVDGAARIQHAIQSVKDDAAGWHGVLLKDYQVAEW